EIVADVVDVIVGECDQDRLAPFRLHVVNQAGRAGILGRLLDAKGGPAAVTPEPGIHKDKIAIIRRGELYDAGAAPTHHRLPFTHRLLLRCRALGVAPGRSYRASAPQSRDPGGPTIALDHGPAYT